MQGGSTESKHFEKRGGVGHEIFIQMSTNMLSFGLSFFLTLVPGHWYSNCKPDQLTHLLVSNTVQGTGYTPRSCGKQIDCKQDY